MARDPRQPPAAAPSPQILITPFADVAVIRALYDDAITFQKRAGLPAWSQVDPAVIDRDIRGQHQYALTVDGTVAGIFSLCPDAVLDRELWRGRDPQAARYINRIIVRRSHAGQGLFGPMLAWCRAEARRLGVRLLRMDTWADNPALVAYYQRHGFTCLGAVTTSQREDLPAPYRGLRLMLLERGID